MPKKPVVMKYTIVTNVQINVMSLLHRTNIKQLNNVRTHSNQKSTMIITLIYARKKFQSV
jgi:hypothetical protein